jgi:hypothetical protein
MVTKCHHFHAQLFLSLPENQKLSQSETFSELPIHGEGWAKCPPF